MRPSRPPNWGMGGSSTSRAFWDAIPRPSDWGWGNWKARTNWTRVARAKRGRPETVDRECPGDRRQFPDGARGPHRGRPDEGRGEMDEPVAAADRQADRRVGDPGQSSRRFPAPSKAPIPQAEGVEE